MLLKVISFDSDNPNWESDLMWNLSFLHSVEQHINDILHVRGYIYLNQICEMLNVEWDTDEENLCVKFDKKTRVEFETFDEPNSSFIVHIKCHN